MPTLKEQLGAALKAADDLKIRANTTMSATDRAAFVGAVEKAKHLHGLVKAALEDEQSLNELNALGGGEQYIADPTGPSAKALGPQFRSLFKATQAGTSLRVDVPAKDFLGSGFGLPATISPNFVRGDYPNNIANLPNLFRSERANSPTVRIYRVSGTAAAGQVAEGATKPLSGLTQDHLNVDMVKFAVRDRISREAIEDFGRFQSVLTGELMQAVTAQRNAYAVSTVLGTTGLVSVVNASLLDGISAAKSTLLGTTGWMPDAVVVNPVDLANAEQLKASTAGVYLIDPLATSPSKIHGIPVVSTPAVAAGTWLLGSFATAGTWFEREAVNISTGLDGDDFSTNMQSLIVECRCALGITRPGHIVKGAFA